jgi:putative redox protein
MIALITMKCDDIPWIKAKIRNALAKHRCVRYCELVSDKQAEVKLIKDQCSEAKVRGFTVIPDEPESIGGTGQGPTPTDYFIASVGFCENVIFARNASLAGLSLDSLETTVTGSWDKRGLFEIDNIRPILQEHHRETKVPTRDPVERVVQVARETHRRCPVHATLARATEITFKLVVNAESVPIETIGRSMLGDSKG